MQENFEIIAVSRSDQGKGASRRVGVVARASNHLPHAVSDFIPDVRVLVDYPRDGRT